jgi:hypothetical protein
MAYLRELPTCKECARPATVELMNNYNGSMGYYCKTHGKRALKRVLQFSQELLQLPKARTHGNIST